MKTLIIICLIPLLTACGAYGEPLLLSKISNQQDPCQHANPPSWCGASSGRVTIYSAPYGASGRAVGYIR
jgi:hypothetical protein